MQTTSRHREVGVDRRSLCLALSDATCELREFSARRSPTDPFFSGEVVDLADGVSYNGRHGCDPAARGKRERHDRQFGADVLLLRQDRFVVGWIIKEPDACRNDAELIR
jgi:hypothetical protein